MRLVPGPKQVEIFWDDVSEHEPDYYRNVIDFESYRIWRVSDWVRPEGTSPETRPPARLWAMIDEYDIINEIPVEAGVTSTTLPLGRNTGLEVAQYTPACLSDPRFDGLAEAMTEVVLADTEGLFRSMSILRTPSGRVIPGLEGLVPWETYPAVLDTFFAVTPRQADPNLGIVGKRAIRYYHHLDPYVHNGFNYYYAVTGADHRLVWVDGSYLPAGYGIQEEPWNHSMTTTPGPVPQTAEERAAYGANIYVYPNPATREALAELLQSPPTGHDPTGVRVIFNNLPAAKNLISVFTLAGDLVATIEHDGTTEIGAATWNLMSRNDQEIVSGVYLYSVESEDARFEDFVGKFVVVR